MTKYSPDSRPERELRLNENVSKLIQDVAGAAFANEAPPGENASTLEVRADIVSSAIQAWRERTRHLPAELFSDPAWGMLLELLHGEIEQRRVNISRLRRASNVAPSTADRWLKVLEERALVVRPAVPSDPAKAIVELTPRASTALRHYFRDVAGDRSH